MSDRDESAGRPPRNARPRDRLGRPLPYGATGVQRQPEGVVRTPEEALREAQRLLDAALPFHAHEVLEDAWKASAPAHRDLWRGLAQLAVGSTHAARGNRTGAIALLRRGAAGIAPYLPDAPYGLDIAALLRWSVSAIERVGRECSGPLPAPMLLPSPNLPAGTAQIQPD